MIPRTPRTRRAILLASLALAVMTGPTGAARAECEGRVKALEARVGEITDARKRALVDFDLRRARKEIGEADEEECGEALDHAAHLLDQK